MNRMTILLFDIDGTLIDSGGAGIRSIEKTFSTLFGIKGAMEEIRPDGMMDPAIMAECYQRHFGQEQMPPEAMEAISRMYLENLHKELQQTNFRMLAGVEETIAHLKTVSEKKLLIGLGTGNIRRGAQLKLERGRLWDHFPFGGFGEDGPERATMLKIAASKGADLAGCVVDPSEVFVVGDTPADCNAAHAADFKCIAVASGRFSREQLTACNPHPYRVLDSLTDLDLFLEACQLS